MARSKAYLYGGVEIPLHCAKELLNGDDVPETATFHFAEGLKDYLAPASKAQRCCIPTSYRRRRQDRSSRHGEWADFLDRRTPTGFPAILLQHDPDAGRRHARGPACATPRCSRPEGSRRARRQEKARRRGDQRRRHGRSGLHAVGVHPRTEFQGQTKDRLATAAAQKIVENAIKDPFDHCCRQSDPGQQAVGLRHRPREDRLRRRQEKDIARKSAVRKLRLPGKLADCSSSRRKVPRFHRRRRQRRRLRQTGA